MSDAFLPQKDEIRRRLEGRYVGAVPHNQALDLHVVDYRPEHLSLALPYREDLVGNPETGVLHGGCITSLIECSTAVASPA
jgi:acyl-coenzyme A thioesterase PaaI-like protein